jgi:hypothetical protein
MLDLCVTAWQKGPRIPVPGVEQETSHVQITNTDSRFTLQASSFGTPLARRTEGAKSVRGRSGLDFFCYVCHNDCVPDLKTLLPASRGLRPVCPVATAAY